MSERYSAHSYGLFSVILEYQPLTNPGESDPNTPLDRPIEVAPDRSWVYYMREFNPDTTNPHSNLPHKSERYIGVSGTCEYFPLVEGQYGNSSTVAYMNGTTRHELDGISVCIAYPSFSGLFMLNLPRTTALPRLPGLILAPTCPKTVTGPVDLAALLSLLYNSLIPTTSGPGPSMTARCASRPSKEPQIQFIKLQTK